MLQNLLIPVVFIRTAIFFKTQPALLHSAVENYSDHYSKIKVYGLRSADRHLAVVLDRQQNAEEDKSVLIVGLVYISEIRF